MKFDAISLCSAWFRPEIEVASFTSFKYKWIVVAGFKHIDFENYLNSAPVDCKLF